MAIYVRNGVIKSTPRPRGGPLAVTPPPPPVPATDGDASALRPYRIARAEYRAELERRHMKTGNTALVRAARKRMHGAAKSLAATPEGRACLAEENGILDDAGPAYRVIARAVEDFRPILITAIDGYATTAREHGFESSTARRWCMRSALFEAIELYLVGEAAAAGSGLLGGRRAKRERNSSATIEVLGLEKAVALAALCAAKSQYALEQAGRINDRYRLEQKERERAAARAAWVPAKPMLAVHHDDQDTDQDQRDDDAQSPPHDDAGRSSPLRHTPDDEDHGAATASHRHVDAVAADDLVPGEDEAHEAVPPMTWCPVRQRQLWPEIAGTPRPGPSTGPEWPKLRAEEDAAIAEWDRRVEAWRRSMSMSSNRRSR